MVDHVATGHMDPLAPLGLTIQTLRNMKAPELLARARSVMSNVGQQLMLAGPGQQEEEAVLGHTGRMLLLAGKVGGHAVLIPFWDTHLVAVM